MGEPASRGWDEKRPTEFMQMVAERAGRGRTRVLREFVSTAERDRGALLQAGSRVIDLRRRLGESEAGHSPAPARYPLSYADVDGARREKALRQRLHAADAELSTATETLAVTLSAFEAAVRQMRTDVGEVMCWANELVAHYRQALERSYLARRKRAGEPVRGLPHWAPPRIEQGEAEEQILFPEDIVNLLPPGPRSVVDQALRHLAESGSGTGGTR
jgi:hypothetical protein